MTPKLKLSLAGTTFLALNGFVALTLDSQFNIFDSLRDISLRGGHLFTQADSLNLNSPFKNLKLNSKNIGDSKEIQLDSSSTKLLNTRLEEKDADVNVESLTLNLSKFTPENKSVGEKVTGIWGEINKEVKIEMVGSQVNSSYDTLKNHHLSSTSNEQINHLEEFHKTKEQVDKWSKTKDKVKSATTLTQSQRVAVQKVYELHDALKTKGENFKEELQKYSDLPELRALARTGAPSSTEIKSSLESINWQKENIKIQKNPTNTRFFSKTDWGAWRVNPYRLFYDNETKWKADISSSNGNARTVHKLEQTIARLNSMGLVSLGPRAKRHIRDEQQKLDQAKSSMNSHIELQVINKLLQYMNIPKAN